MIVRQAVQAYVLANPGKKLREIAAGIGITDRTKITNLCAQLTQLVNAGRLRVERPIGQYHGNRYHPTPTTGQYRTPSTPEQTAAKDRARAERNRVNARARRVLSSAQQQAFYANAPEPPKAARPAVSPLPPPPRAPRPAAAVETVEEFIARGGRIQRLGAHDTSHPLQYDHSHGAALHRPHRRARVAVAH